MNFSTTRLFPLGLMLVLALLTFWLDRAVRELCEYLMRAQGTLEGKLREYFA